MDKLPVQPGTYALILELVHPRRLLAGRLGEHHLPEGIYVYLGSARGPGGLRARLGHHFSGRGRLHWHIDYLRSMAQVRGWAYFVTAAGLHPPVPTECEWSLFLAGLPGAIIPVPKFGASDCRAGCPAHLVHFSRTDFWEGIYPFMDPSAGKQGLEMFIPGPHRL
ncbi:MAG: GIY-YIG nuclease family protein [Anaerolineales bacterium]|nr:GIY-YIG nuclease family protein [Anaerolineales bacterium]